jgi:3-hydroxyisobutyrate dehydrogenase-like beta-hydroxyacid dehydrogenase
MEKLGFIGLGSMGSRMVKRLLDAGYSVTGYNRTPAKAQWLVDAGMQWGDSPRVVAESADVIFSMVSNTDALRAIAEGPDGLLAGLKPGKLFIDMSTVSAEGSRELAAQVADQGAQMLDAPVSGSLITLEQGKLTFMVGGTPEAFKRAEPILLTIGPRVTHMGGNGLAAAMKIATNLSLAVQMLAFSEGVLLAEKSGIKRETAVDVMTHSVIGSPLLQYRGPFVLQMPDEAWFDVNMMHKDLQLALEMGRELDVPLPTTTLTDEFIVEAQAQGLGKEDFAALFAVLAKQAGVKP